MVFIWNYIGITLYPVAAILICGMIVWVCKRLFVNLLGHGGHRAVVVTSIVGTPIHELGHAMMCLLFGHKIVELVLWQPRSDNGDLGYVRHSYNSRKLYQQLGNLFISTGPIFSGMAVLSLLMMGSFPNTWSAYVSSAALLVEEGASVLQIISSGLGMILDMITEFGSGSISVWIQLMSVLIMLSVSLHINLSPADIKGAVQAVPPYLAVTLVITVVVSVLGTAVTGLVLGALEAFSAFMMAMFTVVLAFAAVQVALALVIHLLLSPVRR